MKRKAVLTLALTVIGVSSFADQTSSIQVVEGGEGYKFATVSLKDLSRIHCSTPITNIFYSKEKEVEIKSAGNDAYVKILPRKTSGGDAAEKIEYGSHPRELYVECAGETFSIVLVPKDLPAQTVVLKTPFADVKKATQYEKSNPYDNTMLDLVKKAFVGDVPEGYEPVHVGKEIKDFEELHFVHLRTYTGAKYSVHEFIIDAKKSISVYESMFIPFLNNPLAISIVKTVLEPSETTRMFVVSLNQDAEKTNDR